MSRFDDERYDDEEFPNEGAFWQANAQRALRGKKGRKALAEMREALLALPEKRLISGALCTVGGVSRYGREHHEQWYQDDLMVKLMTEGEGVCAIGAYLWHKKVKAGVDPQEAFDQLPTLLDTDGGADYETASAGEHGGLTFHLAWSLAYRNDATYEELTPEDRYEKFMAWLDEELAL